MNALKQAAWLFFILLCLAGSGWYFASTKTVTRLTEQTLATMPDIQMQNVQVQQYNLQGILINQLQATSLTHFKENDTHVLLAPHLILKQNDKPTWQITSATAISIRGEEQITFRDHVLIHQNADHNTLESTITTDELVYFPKTKIATTQSPVTFKQANSTVHSLGMKAYLEDKHVELGKAQAIYEPKHG